jgi:chemotaxis protein CheX
MSARTNLGLSPEDVVQIVDDITGAFLAAPAVQSAPDADQPGEVVAAVQLSGAFTGSVICSATRAFAVFCATQMLAVDPDQVDDEAVTDAIGEVANMIGGSVKALLPEPSGLSLPLVSLGGDQRVSVPGATTVASVDLHCAGERLRVSVLARD